MLLQRLEGVRDKGNGQFVAKCPAHDDRLPSLSVRVEGDGTVLIHCFAGCTPLEVLDAVGMTLGDLFPQQESFPSRKPKWNPWTLLELIQAETWIVSGAAEDLAAGRFTEKDFARLAEARQKINRVLEVAYAR